MNSKIAIIGVACRFPGSANNLGDFWQLLRDERDAVMHAAATSLDSEQSLSCESLRRHGQHLTSVGRLGEIGAMRERVRASGRSVADWAREARQVRDAMVRSADAAASVPRVR